VEGIARCAASGNTLLCDGDGTPRCPIISWLDQRKCEPPDDQVHQIVGWGWNGRFPYSHILWLKAHRPELFTTDVRICMNNDWIQYMLCGQWVLDHSSATPFYLQDQEHFRYHVPYLERLGIREESLSRLVPSGTPIAPLLPLCHGKNLDGRTMVRAGSFDHPSAARAVHIRETDELLLSCGTSWVSFQAVPQRQIRPRHLMDPYLACHGGPWGEIVSLEAVGLEIEAWIGEHIGTDKDRYRRMTADALAGGPARDMMQDVLRRFRERIGGDGRFRRLVMVGGPSESEAWSREAAAELGCEIEATPFAKDAGAVGAAMLAAGEP
jgi:sugar (pentulose or hexulose) kinase